MCGKRYIVFFIPLVWMVVRISTNKLARIKFRKHKHKKGHSHNAAGDKPSPGSDARRHS